jgi:hypothetical protein
MQIWLTYLFGVILEELYALRVLMEEVKLKIFRVTVKEVDTVEPPVPDHHFDHPGLENSGWQQRHWSGKSQREVEEQFFV